MTGLPPGRDVFRTVVPGAFLPAGTGRHRFVLPEVVTYRLVCEQNQRTLTAA
ncbi:hypothetical protein F750_3689 [Streptomyces sp. PAMC 26508]|nr:hypothetical protein F750_3689 [Streptomyces sp. PAMC 26508]